MEEKQRKTKQIIIAGVYGLLIFLVAYLIYGFFKPEETCFDGARNQNEEEIDCGGVCRACERLEALSLEIKEIGSTRSGREGFLDGYARIENPNSSLGGEKINYEFKVLDREGNQIGNRQGASFILPQESKYILENNIPGGGEGGKIEFKIIGTDWVKFDSSFHNPELDVINKNIISEFPQSSAGGLIRNRSPFDFSLIGIKVILKDGEGRVRLTNTTEMRTVKSGEEREFKAIWPGKLPEEVVRMEVETEVNIFDSQSVFRRFYDSQKFQETGGTGR